VKQHCRLIIALALLSVSGYSPAAQLALVVGINEYQYAGARLGQHVLENLEGAGNDAILIAQTLRAIGVVLPEERLLIDSRATRTAFIQAWNQMLKQARPGDTLILSYAGHGGQEPETGPPFDEDDQLDETLQFHDFNPDDPYAGSISDDELHGLFKDAGDYNIVFVADTCHSGGLVRGLPVLRSRGGFEIPIQVDKPRPLAPIRSEGDGGNDLAHVTLITANDSDSLLTYETHFNGEIHGALSWYFARALAGGADSDNDRQLNRLELMDYLKEKVRTKMDNQQTPRLLPRGDMTPVIVLGPGLERSPEVAQGNTIAIRVEGNKDAMPEGLRYIRLAGSDYALRFVIGSAAVKVYNHLNDLMSEIANLPAAWQRIIDKQRLLEQLDGLFTSQLRPVEIKLLEGNGLHQVGEKLHFSVAAQDGNRLSAMTLFNLTGSGEFQPVYPFERFNDPVYIRQYPYLIPELTVTAPYGGDTLVAILCQSAPQALHKLINRGGEPTADSIRELLAGHDCQVGQYAFFTTAEE
jgi:hypothetical protein